MRETNKQAKRAKAGRQTRKKKERKKKERILGYYCRYTVECYCRRKTSILRAYLVKLNHSA